jgi:hypothetical protein
MHMHVHNCQMHLSTAICKVHPRDRDIAFPTLLVPTHPVPIALAPVDVILLEGHVGGITLADVGGIEGGVLAAERVRYDDVGRVSILNVCKPEEGAKNRLGTGFEA